MRLPPLDALAVVPLAAGAWLCVAVLGAAACSGDAAGPAAASPALGGSANGGATASSSPGGASSSGTASQAGSSSGKTAQQAPDAGGTGTDTSEGGSSGDGVKATSCKRGIAYGHHSIPDLQALSPGVAWWYNWDFRPDTELRDGAYLDASVEYVPMIWGEASDRGAAKKAIGSDAPALLGFNEPNFGSQANLSADAAAALWPELEAIADAKGLRLVSPAVNFCGGTCQDKDPFHYLDVFFAACAGCRVDAVAFHVYVGCSPAGDNKAQWLIEKVETYKTRFSQPLWLTEFACDSAKNDAEQQAFLEDALAYLEAEPRIERYAWFSGRASNVPHVDLLGESGQLTALGQAYVDAPAKTDCVR